jgi:hypothetical protein
VALVLGIAGLAWGQFRSAGDSVEEHLARDDSFDGKFHYCRAVYRINPRGQGGSWLTDYPLADIYLSIRLSELTKIRVSFDAAKQPNHLIVRLTSDELYRCPIILMQEVGRVFFNDEDAKRLREYLLKGGFLWVDDFWGRSRGTSGRRRSGRCFRRASSRSSTCRWSTRSSTRTSTFRACHRFPVSDNSGEEARRNGALTAPRCTCAASPIVAAG